ncbi:LGFP repeat-containing protein [Streptomyces sviceus]|uniref:LGFP repeat-containing protein n=1 Tax=Streptomyces sviceus TaxID=285530 RepID=UPI00331901F2
MSWERSYLGYPVSDESGSQQSRYSLFQHGRISWTPSGGAVAEDMTSKAITRCGRRPNLDDRAGRRP